MNLEKNKLYGMKSHNRHMYMQILILITFRDLFPKKTWDAPTKISHFFSGYLFEQIEYPIFKVAFNKYQ